MPDGRICLSWWQCGHIKYSVPQRLGQQADCKAFRNRLSARGVTRIETMQNASLLMVGGCSQA